MVSDATMAWKFPTPAGPLHVLPIAADKSGMNPTLVFMKSTLPAVLAAAIGLAACASELAVERQVLVHSNSSAVDPAALAALAGRSAGVPARYVAAAGAQWHALALSCRPSDCDAAIQRLAADRAHFESVQGDERKRGLGPAK